MNRMGWTKIATCVDRLIDKKSGLMDTGTYIQS